MKTTLCTMLFLLMGCGALTLPEETPSAPEATLPLQPPRTCSAGRPDAGYVGPAAVTEDVYLSLWSISHACTGTMDMPVGEHFLASRDGVAVPYQLDGTAHVNARRDGDQCVITAVITYSKPGLSEPMETSMEGVTLCHAAVTAHPYAASLSDVHPTLTRFALRQSGADVDVIRQPVVLGVESPPASGCASPMGRVALTSMRWIFELTVSTPMVQWRRIPAHNSSIHWSMKVDL